MTWKQAEQYVGRVLNGRTTVGSGRGHAKGDVHVQDQWIIEVKSTAKDSIKLERQWLTTLEAHTGTRDVALVVFTNTFIRVLVFEPFTRSSLRCYDFQSWESSTMDGLDEEPRYTQKGKWVCMDLDDFELLM